MILSDYLFEELLTPALLSANKGRIKAALNQFFQPEKTEISYDLFYSNNASEFLMQSDVLPSLKIIDWNSEKEEFENGFSPVMIISNSCDFAKDNERPLNQKDALFAPLIPLDDWVNELYVEFNLQQINSFLHALKRQEHTNLFYLPLNNINKKEYIVRLDRIYWLPQSQLKDIAANRFISLSQWGHYLFLTKVALHMCRVPETQERFD